MPETQHDRRSPRIGYLISQYPATSHTFIGREVFALRQLGVELDTFSIRAPSSAEILDDQFRKEAEATFTVLKQPLWSFLAAQVATLLANPGGYFRILRLAMSHRTPGFRSWLMAFVYFAEALLLARELRRRRIGRLHNHFANAGAIVGMLAASLLGIPWSLTMHGISETDYPAGLLLARKIEAADFVACVSFFGRSQAMRIVSPALWPKLHIVRCGIALDELPLTQGDRAIEKIICVGRLSPEKGQAGLIEAFAAARLEIPSLQLVFVGDGPEMERLKAIAHELNAADAITFVGRQNERETLERIAEAGMFVLPSFMEGLPVVLMEALALGTPVVASRVAGIPELVVDGQTGLLFTPSDWVELADRMQNLAANPELRSRFEKLGKSAVKAGFDIELSARRMTQLFQLDLSS